MTFDFALHNGRDFALFYRIREL